MADDFHKTIADHHKHHLSEDQQKKVTAPVQGSIQDEHKNFLKTLFSLLDDGKINPEDPQTFIKNDVYSALSEEWQDKVDVALVNIANQIRLIRDLRVTAKDADVIHLETMVEQLWEMKQRIEEHHDVFIF